MGAANQSKKVDCFKEIQEGIEYLTAEPNVSLSDLMNDDFIGGNTDFKTFQSLLEQAGVKSDADFENPNFARFIKTHTRFGDWEDMLAQAGNQYTRRHI